jgi:hypothetical protein
VGDCIAPPLKKNSGNCAKKKKVKNKKKPQKRQIERRNFIPIISKAPGKHTTFSLILKLQVCGRRCAVCKLEDLS